MINKLRAKLKRAKLKEPMSNVDRAALEARLDRLFDHYREDQEDLQRRWVRDMEDLDKDINKAVMAHAEKQAQE